MSILHPVEANSVFLGMSDRAAECLRGMNCRFYSFIGGGVRLMFGWDTAFAVVDALAADLRRAVV